MKTPSGVYSFVAASVLSVFKASLYAFSTAAMAFVSVDTTCGQVPFDGPILEGLTVEERMANLRSIV